MRTVYVTHQNQHINKFVPECGNVTHMFNVNNFLCKDKIRLKHYHYLLYLFKDTHLPTNIDDFSACTMDEIHINCQNYV